MFVSHPHLAHARLRWHALRAALLLTLLLSALVPSVLRMAQSRVPTSTAQWLEVCTPQGMRLVAYQADSPTRQPEAPHTAMLDCPLCLLAQTPSLGSGAAHVTAVPQAAWRYTRTLAFQVALSAAAPVFTLHPPARAPPAALVA